MDFNCHEFDKGIYNKEFNHKFDMIIKSAKHYKRKRSMKIPAQYNKSEDYINSMKILAYETYIFRRQYYYTRGNLTRYKEKTAKELKVLRNRIKHQTRCTFDRVYALMRFENEM